MIIKDVRAALFRRQRERPIANGRYVYGSNNYVFVQVVAEDGRSGLGWTVGDEIVLAAVRSLTARVRGLDVFAADRLWESMYLPKLYGRRGLTTRAMSAIDIAVWDLKGKALGLPLYRLLGAHSPKARGYFPGGYYEESKGIDGLIEEMTAFVTQGARAVKLKVGRAPIRHDVDRVRAVRAALGSSVDILVDANNAYAPYEAIQIGRQLERLGVFWFEEPVAADDLEGSARVAAALDLPIASGENEYTRYGFREMIKAKAADIFNADAQTLGGITEWCKVADMAAAYDIPIAPHGHQHIHSHLVSAAPNGLMVECCTNSNSPLLLEIFPEPLRVENGEIYAPTGPGLGVSLDLTVANQYRVEGEIAA